MEWLELKGMKFHAFIGHYDEEKEISTQFNVDVKLKVDCLTSGISDKLSDALDYVKVYEIIKKEMNKKCNLVENVANRIKNSLFENFSNIEKLELKVSKLSPQIGGIVGEMSVIIECERKNNK